MVNRLPSGVALKKSSTLTNQHYRVSLGAVDPDQTAVINGGAFGRDTLTVRGELHHFTNSDNYFDRDTGEYHAGGLTFKGFERINGITVDTKTGHVHQRRLD